MIFEEKLIFFPEVYPFGDWEPVLPVGMTCEDLFFDSHGHKLHAWYLQPKVTLFDFALLHCHGNAGNITSRFPKAAALASLGFPVLLFDYRSYGRSEHARLCEKAIYEDAVSALNELHRLSFRDDQIIVHGVSLGGGPASYLAENFSLKALILESTFTSIPDMCKEVYPFIPKMLVGTQFNTLKRIANLQLPKLIIHGDQDETVPYWMGEELFSEALEPKFFQCINGGLHTNLVERYKDDYVKSIKAFIESLIEN